MVARLSRWTPGPVTDSAAIDGPHRRHTNPSGLPPDDPELEPKPVDEEHHEEGHESPDAEPTA